MISGREKSCSAQRRWASDKLLTFGKLGKILKYEPERQSQLNQSFANHKKPLRSIVIGSNWPGHIGGMHTTSML
jgi:hypothetical protein